MGESNPLNELIGQLRCKTNRNEQETVILAQNVTDQRIKRVIELLTEVAPAAETICVMLEQILQFCQNAPSTHRGCNPHLILLRQELTDAANYHSELLKRAHLYLQHMEVMGSSFSANILQPIDSAIVEQQQLADHLRFEGYQLLSTAVSRGPGPHNTISSAHTSAACLREQKMRPLFDNKPLPIDDEYDARWDPYCRVPGSQHGKFLRFPGRFFSPEEEESICDNFNLPESAGLIIDAWLRKYEAINTNFKETRRLPRRTKQSDIDALVFRQRVSRILKTLFHFTDNSAQSLNLSLAKTSGLPYDPDSVNVSSICLVTRSKAGSNDFKLFTRIHPRDTSSAIGPYLASAQRVKMDRLGMGIWEFEDLNRVLETQVTRSRNFVPKADGGRQVYFDRSRNRNVMEN